MSVIPSEARNLTSLTRAAAGAGSLASLGTAALRLTRDDRFAVGFTLIELVVILLLLTVIFGMVGINLTRDDSDVLREEGDRLAVLIQSAQEEAIMQARPFALAPVSEGYEFLRLDDKGKLKPIGAGDVLGPRKLAARVAISGFEVEGQSDAKDPVLVFEPNGIAPIFTIVLRLGDTQWYVQGQSSGKVYSTRLPLADAA